MGQRIRQERYCQHIQKKLRLLSNRINRGKVYNLLRGFKNAKNPVVACLDSDLRNLTKTHITQLAQQILKGEADLTLGKMHFNTLDSVYEKLAPQVLERYKDRYTLLISRQRATRRQELLKIKQ